MRQNFALMKPFGIEINIHWSWLILALLIVSTLATGLLPTLAPGIAPAGYWIAGTFGAIGLFASVLIHEICHALVGRQFKMPMEKITLFLFGGIAHMEDEPPSPRAEFLMAIAGPIASIGLAFSFGTAFTIAVNMQSSSLTQALLSYLASMNVVVALFNLLPGYPLDGGRVLRSALWALKKDPIWATRIAAAVGQGIGIFLVALGAITLFAGQGLSGIWSSLLGFLLIALARSSYLQLLLKQSLRGKTAEIFMNTHPTVVQPDTSIADFMRLAINQGEQTMTPVIQPSGSLLGCANPNSARRFPETEWDRHLVSEILEPCSAESRIEPKTDAEAALSRMARANLAELLVINEGRLIGVLSRRALIQYMTLRGV